MARPDKAAAVAELTEAFRDSPAAVLTEYRGLSVAELKELRRSLAGNATYNVVKNTLAKIAARDAGIEVFESLLEGPSAIAFVSGDAVEVAKGLRAFGREHPNLVVKGGILDGKALSAEEIRTLADLESREVLLAKLVGGFAAPATQLVSVLAAPLRQLAQLLGALEAKAEADPTWVKGEDGATAAPPADAAADTAADLDAPAEPAIPAEPVEAPAPEATTESEPPAEPATPAEVVADATPEATEIAEATADTAAPLDIAADEAAPASQDTAESAAEASPADAAPAEATSDDDIPTAATPTEDTTDGVADASTDS